MKGKRFHKKTMKFEKYDENDDESYNGELIGTADYIAPETLENKVVGIGVDLWALGCILYLFVHGTTPFKDKSNILIFDNILHKNAIINQVLFLIQNIDENTRDLINKLLVKDPANRLGAGVGDYLNFSALKSHPFFNGIDWEHLHKLNPPIEHYHAHQNNYHSFSPERKGDLSYTSKICRKKTFKEHSAHLINLIPIKDTNVVMEGKWL
jgi:serine/threonine protein kinase